MRQQSVWTIWIVVFALIALKSLAGVVGLSKNLRSNYKLAWRAFGPQKGVIKSISQVKPLVIDHLCIDLNQIIHSCIRGSKKAPSISVRMFTKLDNLLTKAPPRKSLVFAVDGAAPYAKVQTQRLRRKLEPDASLITPGTEYMNSMESILLCYAMQRARRFNLQDVAVFISDSTCPGEGELKLIDWIRCHMPAGCQRKDSESDILTTDTVAICGSDADILVQGLAQQTKCPNLHVIQSGMDSVDSVCNITALLESIAVHPPPPTRSMNETRLNATNQSFSTHKKEKARVKVLDAAQIPLSVRSDLVIRFCLAGNDYLPKLRGVPLLLDLHSTYMKQLPLNQRHIVDTANKTFNFVALWALMREADAATGEVLALPVNIPSVVDALNEEERITRASKIKTINQAVSSAVHLAEWNWTTTLLPPNTVIRSYMHPESGKVQYFLPPPVDYTQDANHTIYHLNESLAYTAEHNLSVFKNNLAWVCSLQHQGHTYISLRLRHIKPSARRHLADLVLQDWRRDAHEALKVKRNTALEVLERMRLMAVEEIEARRRELGFNITLQVPALKEDRAAPKSNSNPPSEKGNIENENHANNDMDDLTVDGDFNDVHCVTEDHNELLLNTGTVPRRAYLQYLRDSDIEQYLRGLLWVEHMYTQGRCSDLSYTYNTPLPAVSALAVQAYIERRALEHWHMEQSDYPNVTTKVPPIVEVIRFQQAALARGVFLPESTARPLTADAAAVCVTPDEGAAYLPLSLRLVLYVVLAHMNKMQHVLYAISLLYILVVLCFIHRESRKEIDAALSAQITHNNSEIFCSTYDEVASSIDKVTKHSTLRVMSYFKR